MNVLYLSSVYFILSPQFEKINNSYSNQVLFSTWQQRIKLTMRELVELFKPTEMRKAIICVKKRLKR